MKIKLEITNQTKKKLPKINLDQWLEKTVKILKRKEQGRIELYFVESKEIKKLNKEYRGKDKETDVLSFSFIDGVSFPGDNLVGQIFIEPEIAKKQASEHGLSFAEELEFLFVHALLHVFGYDHEKKSDFKEMYGLHSQIMPDRKWGNFVDQVYREYFGE